MNDSYTDSDIYIHTHTHIYIYIYIIGQECIDPFGKLIN